MLKSFKKKMVQRKYRERSQPEWRKKKGFLEKKVDYQKRAKAYNKKKAMLKILNTKAQLKNPDEFYFKMQTGKMNRFGQVTFKDKKGNLENDEEFKKIMKTKNQNVLKLHLYRLEKKISKMKPNLHFLGKRNPERIEIDLDNNNEEDYLEENKNNFLETEILSKKDLPQETRKNYAVYFKLIHKRDKLKRLYMKLDEEKALLNSKERRKVIKKNNKNTVKFFRERKR